MPQRQGVAKVSQIFQLAKWLAYCMAENLITSVIDTRTRKQRDSKVRKEQSSIHVEYTSSTIPQQEPLGEGIVKT